jgi:hypothetical protein
MSPDNFHFMNNLNLKVKHSTLFGYNFHFPFVLHGLLSCVLSERMKEIDDRYNDSLSTVFLADFLCSQLAQPERLCMNNSAQCSVWCAI